MRLPSWREIARRAVFARDARYQRVPAPGSGRSKTTRVLHGLLLLTVIHQLVSSEFIDAPLPGNPPSTLYSLHEYIGIGALGLVAAFWLWAVIRHGETRLGCLVPWLSPRRMAAVFADIRQHLRLLRSAVQGGAPPHESSNALASAVHGLGLLVLTAMAASGTVFFFAQGTALAHDALDLHRLIANLMWIYLFGHAGVAALHHLLGSDILLRMFGLRRGITVMAPSRERASRTLTQAQTPPL